MRKERAKQHHKKVIELNNNYTYLQSFFKGDILPTGKINSGAVYTLVKHKYCGNIVLTRFSQFSKEKEFNCTKCCGSYEKSFAYHIEQELGLDINDVWDFEKNTVNPYHISKNYQKSKVWIKCQEKDYHGSYRVLCSKFALGRRCSLCNPRSRGNIHRMDSFGVRYSKMSEHWSKNNIKSPFDITCDCDYIAEFNCPICNKSFKRRIANLTGRQGWCPHCSSSKGERRTSNWLKDNNIPYIYDQPYFSDLIGLGGGILRPDFILEKEKIWIEYDGEYHYKPIKGEEALKQQKEHDKLKNEYAKKHEWKMIRIPYWEFDNIEEILGTEITNIKILIGGDI